MMRTEAKWKWFKRFINLIMLIAGGLTGTSLYQWDLTLFAVSLILAVVVIQIQIMIGFLDALLEDS